MSTITNQMLITASLAAMTGVLSVLPYASQRTETAALGVFAISSGIFMASNRCKNKFIRFGLIFMGIASIAYGISLLCKAYFETLTKLPEVIPSKPPAKVINQKEVPAPQPSVTEQCKQGLDDALQALSRCPESKALWDEQTKESGIKFLCGNNLEFDARLDPEKREITLAVESDHKLNSLVMELSNLTRYKFQKAQVPYMYEKTALEYVLSIEKSEYKAAKQAYKIIEKCISRGIWPVEWNSYAKFFEGSNPQENWHTFEGYMKTVSQHHKNLFINHHKKLCDKS